MFNLSSFSFSFFLTLFFFTFISFFLVGCMNSKEDDNLRETHLSPSLVNLPSKQIKSPLSEKEIESRIECPDQAQTIQIGKIVYRFAYVSQRGYYPDC